MKLKLQDGGVVSYTPFTYNPGTISSKSSTEDKKDKITGTLQKEIVDILKQNGIPSDVNAFMDKANSYLSQSQSLSNMAIFGGTDTNYTMQQLMQIQKMANEVKFNHETYKDAATNLGNEDAWGDLALNDRGQMYVLDNENKLKQVSISDYKEHADDYRALTYSNLMGLRERDLAMDVSVLNDAKNAVGMKSIADHIKNIVTAFGENSSQYYTTNKESVKRGLNAIMGQEDAYYKVSESTKVDDINRAIGFLYSNLAPAMRNRLRAEAVMNGQDPHEYLAGYLQTSLQEYNKTDKKMDFDSSKTEFHAPDHKSSSGDGSLGEVPYLVRVGRGDGEKELVNISMRTDSVMQSGSMMAWASNMGSLIDKNGNVLGMDSLPNILSTAEAMKAASTKDITFGGQLLTDAEKNFIVYDGTSQLTDVWLPYKNVGGKITPDFDKLQKFNEWNDWVFKNPGVTKVEKMNEAAKRGLDPAEMIFDEQSGMWQFKPQKMKLFLSFSAYADNDNVDFTKLTESLTEEVSNEVGKQYKDVFNNLFEFGKTHRQKSDKKTGMSYDTVRRWDLRKGNVFIPINSDFLAMHMSMKEYAPKSEMNQFAARSMATRQMNYSQNNEIASLGQFR